MPRVVITTEVIRDRPGRHLDLLTAAGYEVHSWPTVPMTEDDTIAAARDAVALIAGSEPYTDRVIGELPKLRIISRNGVGYDRVDVPAATRRGVAVTITPEGNYSAVAEHALALMLAVARSVVQSTNDTRNGLWKRRTIFIPLRGRTLGVVGLGRIGRATAQRAAGFGMRLLATETYPDQEFVKRYGIELVDLDTLLTHSDFVTLHTPMSGETSSLINRQTLAKMKRGSVLINTARGGLVNEDDLLAALQSGHLAGAGLDVLAVEPPPANHPLLALENVIVSPHVAALDVQAVADMAEAAAQNIVDCLSGRWPTGGSLLNPEVQANHRR